MLTLSLSVFHFLKCMSYIYICVCVCVCVIKHEIVIPRSSATVWYQGNTVIVRKGATKSMLKDSIERGYLLTSFITRISVTTDNGLPLVTGRFLECFCTITLVVLSNLNLFKLDTLLGL